MGVSAYGIVSIPMDEIERWLSEGVGSSHHSTSPSGDGSSICFSPYWGSLKINLCIKQRIYQILRLSLFAGYYGNPDSLVMLFGLEMYRHGRPLPHSKIISQEVQERRLKVYS
jgi:hypothetical protein